MDLVKTDAALITKPMQAGKRGYLNSKSVAFVGIMGALSAVLSFLSLPMFQIAAGVSIDFSHIGTFIVAIGGGAILGAIGGAVAAVVPAFFFANPAFIPGKLLTGFCVGAIYSLFKKRQIFEKGPNFKLVAMLLAGCIGYIPESIFTYWDLTFITGMPAATVTLIIIKAWIEIPIISFIIALLFRNTTISDTVKSMVGDKQVFGKVEYAASITVITITMLFIGSIYMINGGLFTSPAQIQQALMPWVIGMVVILAVSIVFIILKIRKGKSI